MSIPHYYKCFKSHAAAWVSTRGGFELTALTSRSIRTPLEGKLTPSNVSYVPGNLDIDSSVSKVKGMTTHPGQGSF